MEYVEPKELLETGLVQEVNRHFFHPRGMALAVVVEDDGTHSGIVVQDHRKEPGGMLFGPNGISDTKKAHAEQLLRKNLPERVRAIGGLIQDEC